MPHLKSTPLLSLLLLMFSLQGVFADTAAGLNQQGLDLYRAGKYGPALNKFEKAIQANPRYGWGHYNLACTLGVIRKRGNICEHNAYKGRIIEHLQKAVKYQPVIRNKFEKDPDLTPVHDTVGYLKLKGYSLKNARHFQYFLQKITWYGPAPGVYGHISGIDFTKDMKISYWYLDMSGSSGIPRKVFIRGKYRLRGGSIIITFEKSYNGKNIFHGSIDKKGRLTIKGLSGPFLDIPDECSA